MTVGDRIKTLRKDAGYSRTAFAEKIGIPHTTLRNYENSEREPGHNFLILISKEFSVTVDYLLGLATKENPSADRGNGLSSDTLEVANAYAALPSDNDKNYIRRALSLPELKKEIIPANNAEIASEIMPSNVSRFPIPRQSFAGGFGIDIDDDSDDEIDVIVDNITRKADFVVRVDGPSMEPNFPDGCLVAVRRQETLQLGDIGAVIFDGEPLIKRLGIGQLESFNPKCAPKKIYSPDQIVVRGKVLGIVEEA